MDMWCRYRDARDAVHMLLHGFYDEFVGAHGWTTDPAGITGWEFSATAAYTQAVNLDGNMTTLSRRERPQVVIQNGTITHLFHGAEAPGRRHTFIVVVGCPRVHTLTSMALPPIGVLLRSRRVI